MGFYGTLVIIAFLVSYLAIAGSARELALYSKYEYSYGTYASMVQMGAMQKMMEASAKNTTTNGMVNWTGAVQSAAYIDGFAVQFLNRTVIIQERDNRKLISVMNLDST
jgi:hypothetical protein